MSTFVRTLEFSVDVIHLGETWAFIDGRCCRDVIRVGDVFTVAYRYDFCTGESPHRTNERPVSLRVDSITAYRRQWRQIEPGLTARISVIGEGAGNIGIGLPNDGAFDLLGGTSDLPTYTDSLLPE